MNRIFLAGVLAVAFLAAPLAAQTDLGPLNLPAAFKPLPLTEDFEAAAGVIPPYMAVTELESATLLPDPEAWANIGQRAACINPYSGSFNLEMGMIPGTTNYHNVRNALVMGIDGTAYAGSTIMAFQAIDGGEETAAVDGVWVSDTGVGASWYPLVTGWGALIGPTNTWELIKNIDWSTTPIPVNAPFYLAFVQEDNFPYLDLDGIGIDDILMPQPLYIPSLSLGDAIAGQYVVATVSDGPPGGTATFLGSLVGLGSDPFGGVTTGLSSPFQVAVLPMDTAGAAVLANIVPGKVAGLTVWVQGLTTDGMGNWLTQVVEEFVD